MGTSRRDFLKKASQTALAAGLAAPYLHADDKAGSRKPIVGAGEFTYEAEHQWGELPDSIRWGETHGVAVDKQGHIYIKHTVHPSSPSGDAIVVFDPEGKFVRSFGSEYRNGGHGIDIREEDGTEFLYLCDIHNRIFVKTDLRGEKVFSLRYPEEPELYQSIQQFRPTNVAFAPNGDFYVADGYGSHYISQYTRDGKWIRTFGGAGDAPGKLKTPHGIWLDDRGDSPRLVVADRANARLQYFTLEGEHLSFVDHDFRMPAHFDLRGDLLLVPDLKSRVTILGKDNSVVAQLGGDEISNLRDRPPAEWIPGKFIHPHDACFDADGNIYVVEWVPIGRVTKLTHIS